MSADLVKLEVSTCSSEVKVIDGDYWDISDEEFVDFDYGDSGDDSDDEDDDDDGVEIV